MLILALDTCDLHGSVALLRDNSVLQAVSHDTAEDYSSWLLPAVGRVLEAAGSKLDQVDVFAAAAGPGSFTGVRVGLTTVKAWAEVYGRGIAAVSRLEALAEESSGKAPYVAPFFDARRNQVFGALFRRQGAQLQRLEEEMVIAPDKFLDWCAAQTAGEPIDWVATDPKCLTQTAQWALHPAASKTIEVISPILAPRIGKIGYQQARDGRLIDAPALDANYVRRSDAELFWKGGSPMSPDKQPVPTRKIRPFRSADAIALAKILDNAAEAAQWPLESYDRMTHLSGALALVCETETGVTGFLIARQVADEAEVLNVAVLTEARRQGQASALLTAALDQFRNSGVLRVFLEVRESNQPAITFYSKQGFISSGRRKAYYRDPVEDALCMELKFPTTT